MPSWGWRLGSGLCAPSPALLRIPRWDLGKFPLTHWGPPVLHPPCSVCSHPKPCSWLSCTGILPLTLARGTDPSGAPKHRAAKGSRSAPRRPVTIWVMGGSSGSRLASHLIPLSVNPEQSGAGISQGTIFCQKMPIWFRGMFGFTRGEKLHWGRDEIIFKTKNSRFPVRSEVWV